MKRVRTTLHARQRWRERFGRQYGCEESDLRALLAGAVRARRLERRKNTWVYIHESSGAAFLVRPERHGLTLITVVRADELEAAEWLR